MLRSGVPRYRGLLPSGFSSVYFERVMKGRGENGRSGTKTTQNHQRLGRNAQMATFQTFIASWVSVQGWRVIGSGALAGSPIVWSVVALQATGGLCAAAVIAYATACGLRYRRSMLSTFIGGCGSAGSPASRGASMVLGNIAEVYASAAGGCSVVMAPRLVEEDLSCVVRDQFPQPGAAHDVLGGAVSPSLS